MIYTAFYKLPAEEQSHPVTHSFITLPSIILNITGELISTIFIIRLNDNQNELR